MRLLYCAAFIAHCISSPFIPMKKLLLSVAAAGAILATTAGSALAHDGFLGFGMRGKIDGKLSERSEGGSSSSSSVDYACVQAAVSVREQALVSGLTAYNSAELSALTTRKSSLSTAWSMSDASARRTAVKAAWDAYLKSDRDASKQWKTDQKNAWSTFRTSVKTCSGASGAEVNLEMGGHLRGER